MLHKKARIALDFRNKGRPAVNRGAADGSRLDGAAVRYRSMLKQWVETLEERDRVEAHYQAQVCGHALRKCTMRCACHWPKPLPTCRLHLPGQG
jgi:hypothetical protein